MEKVIRNGKVAVAYSPGYGSGWASWHGQWDLVFHPLIIQMIESGNQNEIDSEWIEENIGIAGVYGRGGDLDIKWLPVGTKFAIEEYDGNEYFITEEDLNLTA